jgi:hypothetical protein
MEVRHRSLRSGDLLHIMVGQDTFQISVYFCKYNRPVHFKPTVERQIKVLIIFKESFLKSVRLSKVT